MSLHPIFLAYEMEIGDLALPISEQVVRLQQGSLKGNYFTSYSQL